MPIPNRLILFLLVLLGVAWSACLVLSGLVALASAGRAAPFGPLLFWAGVAGIAAGNFVFMEVVADRLVHPRRRRVLDAFELLMGGAMLVAVVMMSASWLAETS
jgi:hypothetical protein